MHERCALAVCILSFAGAGVPGYQRSADQQTQKDPEKPGLFWIISDLLDNLTPEFGAVDQNNLNV